MVCAFVGVVKENTRLVGQTTPYRAGVWKGGSCAWLFCPKQAASLRLCSGAVAVTVSWSFG